MPLKLEKKIISDNSAIAITSLAKCANGKIYIGLTSRSHTVYEYDPGTESISDMGAIFPKKEGVNDIHDKIHNSLIADGDTLYIGQGLNITWNAWPYNFNLHKYCGGHLYSLNTLTGKCDDLGMPVPLNAIHGMTMDKASRCLYGYTIPDNHFFKYDINTGVSTDYGKISPYACHNYVSDQKGNVYGAWKKDEAYDEAEQKSGRFIVKGTFLLKYDGCKDELIRTQNMIVYGNEYDIFCNVGVDSWLCTEAGDVFGGTAITGIIFKVLKDDAVEYIGKPVGTPRLTSMVEGPDGLIYGCAGFPHMHIFTLDPKTNAINDLGPISEEGDFCYAHCMVFGDDGALYAGETDAGKACLYKITF